MPKRIITELSDEQEAMLPIYREKWRSIQISTESIEQEKVAAIIKTAYAVSDYPEPEILFYSSPMTAIEKILTIENFKAYLGRDIHMKFGKRVIDHLLHGITEQLDEHLCIRLRNQIQHPEYPYYSTHSHPLVSYFPYTGRCLEHQLIADLDKLKLEFRDYQEINYPILWGGRLARPRLGADKMSTPQEKLYVFLFGSPLLIFHTLQTT
ncbi:MAG: hypothetical protein RMY64_00800 [Nostoc sp. DedQUE08]|uniref:hypothetical protein n=1 Tax=Nostoc sp. DedQUE08 TaxID=3075393 RepID=UPI002AD46C49|nr:hypothetical protein [Nostoc sp. DedQUE08]MDZ8064167.1 hypothetical protein [Nostoc sp. DedQUE08]